MAHRRNAEVMVSIDHNSKLPLYRQLYEQLRGAIGSGALVQGDRLPSIRSLARDTGVSHITVENVYQQLALEGYVDSAPRSGFVVRHIDVGFLGREGPDNDSAVHDIARSRLQTGLVGEATAGSQARFDFSFFNLQPGSFPRRAWERAQTEAMLSLTDKELTAYPMEVEPGPLRCELARYLARTRGVRCTPEQVLVAPSTEDALTTLLSLFDRTNDLVGIEEPGYAVAYQAARRNGFGVVLLTCGKGCFPSFMAQARLRRPALVFTTPSHQFPTGIVMPLGERIELLKWAAESSAYVIEDDSCNEYRYSTRAIPSLQSLDVDNRVVYLGNFSKTLSPSLRVSFMVLPPELLGRLYASTGSLFSSVSITLQRTLANFIAAGDLDQHVRRMTTDNRRRHGLLLAELENAFGSLVDISGIDSGMHFFVTVNNGMDQDELIESARAHGANVYGTKAYWFAQDGPDNTVMIGFSAIALEDIPEGVRALRDAWLRL